MTAVALESIIPPLAGTPRGTNGGGKVTDDAGWNGTTNGVAATDRAVAVAGTVLRSMALGMLEAFDPGWLSSAARYYQLMVDDVPGTGAALILRREEQRVEVGSVAFMVPDRVIAEIRATLGLNISETARALGVERPTVYAWLEGRVTPQRANLLRLGRVADIAASWRRRTRRPLGDLVRIPGEDGRSIVELLAEDTLPDRDLQDRLDAAVSQVLSPGARLRARGVTGVHEAAARHGLSTRPPGGSAAEIDWLTRPSFGDDDD